MSAAPCGTEKLRTWGKMGAEGVSAALATSGLTDICAVGSGIWLLSGMTGSRSRTVRFAFLLRQLLRSLSALCCRLDVSCYSPRWRDFSSWLGSPLLSRRLALPRTGAGWGSRISMALSSTSHPREPKMGNPLIPVLEGGVCVSPSNSRRNTVLTRPSRTDWIYDFSWS
ncbi:hypothetical protein K456DRAFT_1171278 [Colletotrichum gloeosporioides 23]|nr:hypothetical protein K456DRAFT_1171278 [Colletotrichum gloeosporioides 23]